MAASLEASGGDGTSRSVVTAFEGAFRDVLKAKVEGEVLSPFGIDRGTLLKRGLRYLGEEQFSKVLAEVRAAQLETDFLVAGWESSGVFRMFSVSDPGVASYHDPLGFHCIGAGTLAASGYLCGAYHMTMSTEELVYRLCEAKFIGESAPGVGRQTLVWIVEPQREASGEYAYRHSVIIAKHVEAIRIVSEQHRHRVPDPGVAAVTDALTKLHRLPWSA